ncbi:MAG TPA: hypothetical protein VN739_07795 [Nitrososphaerales archaeon]|nr:hypothetical protein [Nitrososphaerales archaeon]
MFDVDSDDDSGHIAVRLPTFREAIVLYVIKENYGVTGYRIRKIYIQVAGMELSFGTLVPLLQRFEKEGLVAKDRPAVSGASHEATTLDVSEANNWHLTRLGIEKLDELLSRLDKMLPSRGRDITTTKQR